MSDFGFDSNIILSAPRLAMESAEAGQATAKAAQAQYDLRRQQSLADLARQNPGTYSDPTAQALARGGFADEANTLEQQSTQRQANAAKLMSHYADITRSQLASATPERAQQIISGMRPELRTRYGLPEDFDPNDPEHAKAVQSFVASGMEPEKQGAYIDTTQRRSDLADPETPTYKATAAFLQKLGIPVEPGMNLNGFSEKTQGIAEKLAGAGLLAGSRVTAAQTAADARTDAAQTAADAKRDTAKARGGGTPAPLPDGSPNPYAGMKPAQVEGVWKEFRNAISTTRGRGNLNVKNEEAFQRAEALEALLHVKDLNTITEQQKVEAATALAGLVSRGGSQAISQIEHLTPESYAGKFSDFKQKLLNEPQGAEAGKFLENMLDTAKREKGLITQQIRRGQLQPLPDFLGLRRLDAKRFDNDLHGAGIDPASLDMETGLERAAQASGGGVGLAADKQKRLAELRAKRDAGALK